MPRTFCSPRDLWEAPEIRALWDSGVEPSSWPRVEKTEIGAKAQPLPDSKCGIKGHTGEVWKYCPLGDKCAWEKKLQVRQDQQQ